MNKRALLSLLVAAGIVSACSSMPSWMGGKKDDKEKLTGERIAVLPVDSDLKPDDEVKAVPVTLPPATPNSEWPQHSGVLTPANANIASGAHFENEIHSRAGDGNSFETTRVISPVVASGMVFTMDAVGMISAHAAEKIDNVLWTSKGVSEEDEPAIRGGGLAFDNGKLYAVSGRGIVAAFDAAKGKELWRKSLHLPLHSAPRVSGDKVFVTSLDNQTYALSAADGNILWTQRGINETAGLLASVSPVVSGDSVIVPYSSGEIYVLSAADGKEIWSDSITANRTTHASSPFSGIGGDPVIDTGVVFAVSAGGMTSVQSLATGQHVWERPIGSLNTPWVAGDFVFLISTDNTVVCMTKFDGHIRWSTRLASYENETKKKDPITWKGPVVIDGNVVAVSSNGQMVLLNSADGKITGTRSIPSGIYTSPVVAGGRIYLVGQDATLYSLQ